MNLRLPRVVGSAAVSEGRPLTGRAVLFMLLAFFGIVVAVNIAMVRAAISTFGGVDTPSSYQAGLAFKSDEAAAKAQDSRGWRVSAKLAPAAVGETVSIAVTDAAGRPVSGAVLTVRLAHPIDERRDVAVVLGEVAAGSYLGKVVAENGQWILDIDIAKGGQRVFRSRNRVTIP